MSQVALLEAPKPAAAPAMPRSFTPVARPVVQRKCACGGTPGPEGECDECKRRRLLVQRRASDSSRHAEAPPSVDRVVSRPGRPLDGETRGFMESRFGHDFSGVRIHHDSQAGESARALQAQAYTVGNNVVFAPGKYQPDSHSGRELLAHELAHTIQQGGLQRRASDLRVDTAADSPLEREADAAARAVMHRGNTPTIASRPSLPTLSRATDPTAAPGTSSLAAKLTVAGFEEMEAPPQGVVGIRRFRVLEPFPLPPTKGDVKKAWDDRAKGGGLESIIDITGTPKSVLKQQRPGTDTLRDYWLTKVGWSLADAPQKWKDSGGDAVNFNPPQAGGKTCQMDHIIELQVGGTNIKENIQALDGSENASSGSTLKGYLSGKAMELRAVIPELALTDVILHWDSVTQTGAAICRDCCAVEQKALATRTLDPTQSTEGAAIIERQPVKAGGSASEILISSGYADKKAAVPIADSEQTENKAASTLITGLSLRTLNRSKKQKTIQAKVDDSDKTRLPITLDASAKPFDLNLASDGALSLASKTAAIGFTYKYLSPGQIKTIALNSSGGVDWTGQITPTAKFLPTLDVEYREGTFRLISQVPEDKLKKASFLGATVTSASLNLTLAPKLEAAGELQFRIGAAAAPMATGVLTVGADDQGLKATAKLKLALPKIDTAETTFEYRGDQWSGAITIDTSQIKLPYVTSASLTGHVKSSAGVASLAFSGSVGLTLPGELGTAEVGLHRRDDGWVLAGAAALKLRNTENFSAGISYHLGTETLTASVPAAKASGVTAPPVVFHISPTIQGKLTKLTVTVKPGGVITVSGSGGFSFRKGKASGDVEVTLTESGHVKGKGTIEYIVSEKLKVGGEVEFNEVGKPKLRVTGKLTFARLELMKGIKDDRTLFKKDFSVPIPYASIGTVGLNAFFEIELGAGFEIGPAVIEPLEFEAGFNPLDDDPALALGITGSLKIPASAYIRASLSGGLKIEAYIAEIGGKITITGTVKLAGGVFVPFSGSYANQEFKVALTPEAKLNLLLGVALSASVWAEAGIPGLSYRAEKTWLLAQREIDTKLGFGIKAPVSYSSVTGAKLPTLDQIELIKPEFTAANMERIAGELFGAAKTEEKKV